MNNLGRIESGIPGLDKLIEGGFVKGSVNLIVGTTGTLKTTFSSQFIWHGIQKGEKGVYITVEQETDNTLKDMTRFGFNFKNHIEAGNCIFLDVLPTNFKDLEKATFDSIVKLGAKRFVLDSLTVAIMGLKQEKDSSVLRRDVFRFVKRLRTMGITTLLTTEIPEGRKTLTRFGFEEFVADGIIVLHFLDYSSGDTKRSLMIRKMRRTNHGTDIYPIMVTEHGIEVRS